MLGPARPFTAEDRTLFSLLVRLPRPGAAPRPPDGSAARDGAGAAARHPRPVPAARRVRRSLRAGHPPARGRRRLVRHRRAAGRADRHHGRRLRRARPGAATVMGQLRSACRALLLQDAERRRSPDRHGPVRVVRPRRRVQPPCSAGSSTRDRGRLTYTSAGHPPGIVVHPDGRVDLLEGARSLPLAMPRDAGRTEASCVLPPRSTLLLYTDGLVERRGRPITEGIAAAGAASGGRPGLAGGSRQQLMTGLAPPGGTRTTWPSSCTAIPTPLDVCLLRRARTSSRSVRAQLRGWLRSCGAAPPDGPGRPGRGGRGHRQRDRARPPPPARRGRSGSAPARPRTSCGVTVTDRGAGGPPARRPSAARARHRADAGPDAASHHRAGVTGTTVDMYVRINP